MGRHWNWKKDPFYGLREEMTEEQERYVDSLMSNRLTVSDSVSGSGKTTLAVAAAHYSGKRLLYIFFPVQEDEMGFRPGNQQTKESIYYGPLVDALKDIHEDPLRAIAYNDDEDIQWESMAGKKNANAWVEAKSHIFLRGTNIGKDEDLFVIIDETQNATKSQLKKVLTRLHDRCTVAVIGHTGQIDLENPKDSSFESFVEHFSDKPYANVCNLTKNFRGQLSRDADAW